jgi:hypothetical protein
MEHEESNELLLSRTRQTGRDTAFDDDAETAEEFDAQSWSTSHLARLYRFERAVDFELGSKLAATHASVGQLPSRLRNVGPQSERRFRFHWTYGMPIRTLTSK